jgi:hypothetical protein
MASIIAALALVVGNCALSIEHAVVTRHSLTNN